MMPIRQGQDARPLTNVNASFEKPVNPRIYASFFRATMNEGQESAVLQEIINQGQDARPLTNVNASFEKPVNPRIYASFFRATMNEGQESAVHHELRVDPSSCAPKGHMRLRKSAQGSAFNEMNEAINTEFIARTKHTNTPGGCHYEICCYAKGDVPEITRTTGK